MQKWMEENGKIKVLSTTKMIADVVKEIGKENVDSLILIQNEQDPHSYELVKGDNEKLNRASIIFYNGLGLEHATGLKFFLSNSSKSISVGEYIKKTFPEKIILESNELDPHIWMDISLWSNIIEPIVEALIAEDNQSKDFYKKNAEELKKKMIKEHNEVLELIHKIPVKRRYLVTTHNSFNYFAKAYLSPEKMKNTGEWREFSRAPEGISPEGQLSSMDIKNIIDYLIKYEINALFPESNTSQDSLKKILSSGKEIGLNLFITKEALYCDETKISSKENNDIDYLNTIHYNAKVIYENLMEKN
jgi:manganese/zinc/iron transport system substrate-binding protein